MGQREAIVKKILVTGGAGFIGSHVTDHLVDRGHHVVVLDDLSGGFQENVGPGAKFVKGSVTDIALIDDLFAAEQFDIVFHMAAYAAEGLSHFIKHFNYENNLLGSVNLINAAVNTGVKGLVFTSSIAVYGTQPELPMSEDGPVGPEDSYGIAKLAVEQELKVSHELFGLNYIIFRPHNVYGERQNIGDKYRNVVGIFMNQILKDEPMTVFGTGEQTRAFSYIGDVAPVIAESIDHEAAWNEVFNIGADEPYSVSDLAAEVARAMGVQPQIVHLPARNEVIDAFSSHTKLEGVFGAGQKHSLAEGLGRMAEWVRAHGARESQGYDHIEVWKNFPEAWRQLAQRGPSA